MDCELIEEILNCPSLPSLPAVAVKVIELTSNPRVKVTEIAEVIQNDQALAAKVLRTVNSPFYGLRERCASIHKAVVLLGLSPVKSLALGFSLVHSIGQTKDGFDYISYWRRGMVTAVAARAFAEAAGKKCAEEAFLAGLLQDIGMIAMHRALGERYMAVLVASGTDHRKLCKCELGMLEAQHPDIGAMLAERWQLPQELVIPVKYHERPTAAPQSHVELIRFVALGNYLHDALTESDNASSLRRVYARGQEWFGFTSDQMQALVKKIADASNEMGRLFQLETGGSINAEQILASAEMRMMQMAGDPASTVHGEIVGNVLVEAALIDPATGTVGRRGFEMAIDNGLSLSMDSGEPITLVQLAVEGMTKLGTLRSGDAAVRYPNTVTQLLRKHFDALGGVVCKLGGDLFAVVIFGSAMRPAAVAAEEFCESLERFLTKARERGGPDVTVSPSIGIAAQIPFEGIRYAGRNELVLAAVDAMRQARASGKSGIRFAQTRVAA
jgi:HD-like signal output (HDOD) protein/GGDEF domain-containing protein